MDGTLVVPSAPKTATQGANKLSKDLEDIEKTDEKTE